MARMQNSLTSLPIQVCLVVCLWCTYLVAALCELLHEYNHLRVWILEPAILNLNLGSSNYLLCDHDNNLEGIEMNQTGPHSPGLRWELQL